MCTISQEGTEDIIWWRDNIMKTQKSLQQTSAVDYQLYTDASNTGESDTDHKINGR